MTFPNLSFSWQWLKTCPFCAKEREVLRTELIQEEADGYYFYFQCPHCLVGIIFLLESSRGVPQFFGWPTDLTYGELVAGTESRLQPLAADEVLTFHEFFAKNNQVSLFIG